MKKGTFLGLTHNPFTPPREGFFTGGDRKTHLDHLRHLSQWSRRVLVVTGPFGIGKSSLFHELSNSLEANTKAARLSGAVVTSEREILVGLAQGFGVPYAPDVHADELAQLICEHVSLLDAQSRVCMAMVDDAQLLEPQAVKRMVALVADSGLRMLLFSEASLVTELDRAARRHDLEWFEIRLTGFPRADVRDYLEWRFSQAQYRGLLPFTDEQLENIVVRSGGNPSVVDSMANRLLGEIESGESRKQRRGFPLTHALLAATLVVMVALIYRFVQEEDGEPTAAPVESIPELAQETVPAPQPEPEPQSQADPQPGLVSEVTPESVTEPAAGIEAEAEIDLELEPAVEAPELHLESESEPVSDLAPEPVPNVLEPDPDLTPEPDPNVLEPDADLTPDPDLALEPDPVVADLAPGPDPNVQPVVQPLPLLGIKDGAWLLKQNPDYFTLQLMTLSTQQRALEFIRRQQNVEEFAVYRIQRSGSTLYVITFGVFSGSDAANRAAAGFTGELATINPWVRGIRQVQETVRTFLR